MLAELVLVEQTRETFAAAVVDALVDEFGSEAGLCLQDGDWRIERAAGAGCPAVPVVGLGQLYCPAGGDGARFAQLLKARVLDFRAIEQARERAARLESLYRATQEFTSELDLDRALELIVNSGKELTGADICYLSLTDFERGDTYIRTTAGTRGEAFSTIRLAYGDGLGGLVAKEGRPYYSSDYMHDERFVHVVDAEVSSEGVVSVVGVPLKLRDRVIGVLFIANRYSSTFSEDDVAFLQALGDHAAIAIENARLYGMLDRAARLHRRLTELVLTEQPLEALESEIGAALDVDAKVLTAHEDPITGVATDVRAGPFVLGSLWVDAERLDEERRVAVEQATRVVAVHLLKERAVTQAQLRTRGELLDAIISAAMPEPELRVRASSYGLDLAHPVKAAVFRGDQAHLLARQLPGAFVAGRLGNTVALLAPDTPVPPIDLVGVGPEAVGAAAVARSVIEATRVFEVAGMLGRTGVVCGADLGVYGLLLDGQRARELELQAQSLLAALLDYDDAHDRTLVPTLEAYLDAQGRPKEAAARLNVHVNSLYYRLQRVRELTGWTLDDPEQRLHLQLACRVLRLTAGRPTTRPLGAKLQTQPTTS